MLIIDCLVLKNSSRGLQTRSIISFIINLYLILQMWKDFISKSLQLQLNKALDCPSHRIFRHIHGALNVVEKITNYTV